MYTKTELVSFCRETRFPRVRTLPNGRGSDSKSRSFNETIRAPTVREGLLHRRMAVSRRKLAIMLTFLSPSRRTWCTQTKNTAGKDGLALLSHRHCHRVAWGSVDYHAHRHRAGRALRNQHINLPQPDVPRCQPGILHISETAADRYTHRRLAVQTRRPARSRHRHRARERRTRRRRPVDYCGTHLPLSRSVN